MKEVEELWGIPVVKLAEYGKKYKWLSVLIYIINVVSMLLAVYLMYINGSSFQVYIFVLVLICIVVIAWFNVVLSPNRWAAYRFYKIHYNDKVERKTYNVTAEQLYNVLYCSKYRRLKLGKSLDYYKDLMLSACCEDSTYSAKFMKYIDKYADESGNLSLIICRNGRKLFFINFVEEESNKDE